MEFLENSTLSFAFTYGLNLSKLPPEAGLTVMPESGTICILMAEIFLPDSIHHIDSF